MEDKIGYYFESVNVLDQKTPPNKQTTYRKSCFSVSETMWKKGGFKLMHIICHIIKVYRNELLKISSIAL